LVSAKFACVVKLACINTPVSKVPYITFPILEKKKSADFNFQFWKNRKVLTCANESAFILGKKILSSLVLIRT